MMTDKKKDKTIRVIVGLVVIFWGVVLPLILGYL